MEIPFITLIQNSRAPTSCSVGSHSFLLGDESLPPVALTLLSFPDSSDRFDCRVCRVCRVVRVAQFARFARFDRADLPLKTKDDRPNGPSGSRWEREGEGEGERERKDGSRIAKWKERYYQCSRKAPFNRPTVQSFNLSSMQNHAKPCKTRPFAPLATLDCHVGDLIPHKVDKDTGTAMVMPSAALWAQQCIRSICTPAQATVQRSTEYRKEIA